MAKRQRILILDDDLDILYYVDDVLQELGYLPVKATSAAEVARLAESGRFDAAVLDFEMIPPATDWKGMLLSALRETLPVLVMSRHEQRPEGDSSPIRCFVDHPPEAHELSEALESCISAATDRAVRR